MSKPTVIYWNQAPENCEHWKPTSGWADLIEELTLNIELETGKCAKLTRFLDEKVTHISKKCSLPAWRWCINTLWTVKVVNPSRLEELS